MGADESRRGVNLTVGLARTQFVIVRSIATWRSRHPKDGPSNSEIATLRSE